MSFDFMADLEARVNAAAQRIEELLGENRRLEREVKRRARPESPPPPPPPAPTITLPVARSEKADRAEKSWLKEREEIRRRLEALVERLEALLADGRGAGA